MVESGASEKLVREFGGLKLDDAKAEAELRARIGQAQLRMRTTQEARESFTTALAVDAGNSTAVLGLIRLLAIDGKVDEAISAAERVVAKSP
jgi:thioredoxin-like negative regulator of GroEL